MTILGLIYLLIVMAVIHELGHAIILKHLKLDYVYENFSLTFDEEQLSRKDLVNIIFGGIGFGLLPLLLVSLIDPFPAFIIIPILVWYVICCRHDLKLLWGMI